MEYLVLGTREFNVLDNCTCYCNGVNSYVGCGIKDCNTNCTANSCGSLCPSRGVNP